ncbi:MAG: hypothetical protein JRG91_07870 [Deltaproteobacteria bacterium]|nr:hypothetical protein [Deltaproteobacteria bacterium]
MRGATLALSAIILLSCIPRDRPAKHSADPAGEHRLWLVMVFMNADSGGDPHEWILMDDLELMDATPTGGSIHLVLQVSRCGRDPYDGAWRGTRRYHVDGLGGGDPVGFGAHRLEDPRNDVDPSDGEALWEFARWASARYPADHRMLVVEAHGSGWRGLSPCDIENDPACLITIPDGELRGAIARIAGEHRLDIVALNSCLMGMWETGFALRGSVRYALTSEEIGGPLLGSWHDILPRLARGPDDPASVCADLTATIDGEQTKANTATRTCVDLEGHEALTRAVDGMAAAAASDARAALDLARAIDLSLNFTKPAHHDLGDIAAIISKDADAEPPLRAAAAEVLEALDGYVVAHASSPFAGMGWSHGVCGAPGDRGTCERSTGVAIWAPIDETPHLVPVYLEGPWCATRWDEALSAVVAARHDQQ